MLMKERLKQLGIVDDKTQTISCPICDASALLGIEKLSILHHDNEQCTFIRACRDMKIDPNDYTDERVMRILVIENLF